MTKFAGKYVLANVWREQWVPKIFEEAILIWVSIVFLIGQHAMTIWTHFCIFVTTYLLTSTWTFFILNVDKNVYFSITSSCQRSYQTTPIGKKHQYQYHTGGPFHWLQMNIPMLTLDKSSRCFLVLWLK